MKVDSYNIETPDGVIDSAFFRFLGKDVEDRLQAWAKKSKKDKLLFLKAVLSDEYKIDTTDNREKEFKKRYMDLSVVEIEVKVLGFKCLFCCEWNQDMHYDIYKILALDFIEDDMMDTICSTVNKMDLKQKEAFFPEYRKANNELKSFCNEYGDDEFQDLGATTGCF